MRLLKRGLIVVAGLIAVLAAALVINDRIEIARSERFYAEHPMLSAMDKTPVGGGRSWERFTPILLERVPVGSTRTDAVRILGGEGLACAASTLPTPGSLQCSPPTQPAGVPRWYIQVEFDGDSKVSGGKVLMMKAGA